MTKKSCNFCAIKVGTGISSYAGMKTNTSEVVKGSSTWKQTPVVSNKSFLLRCLFYLAEFVCLFSVLFSDLIGQKVLIPSCRC